MLVLQSAEELLKTRKQDVIDCFVEYFGEEYRQKIEERMSDTSFVFADRENFNKIDYFEKHVEPKIREEIASFYKRAMKRLGFEPQEKVPNITEEMLKDLSRWGRRDLFNSPIITISPKDYRNVARFLCVFLSQEETPQNIKRMYDALCDKEQRKLIENCIDQISSTYSGYRQEINVLSDIGRHAYSYFEEKDRGEVIKAEREFCKNFSKAISNHLAKVFNSSPNAKIQKLVTREMADFFLTKDEYISYYNFDVFEDILKRCEKIYNVPNEKRHGSIEDFIADDEFMSRFLSGEIKSEIRDLYNKRCATLGNEKGGNIEIDRFFKENNVPQDNELIYALYSDIFSSDVMAALHSYYDGERLKNLCRLGGTQQVDECLFHELTHVCDTSYAGKGKHSAYIVKSGLRYDGIGTILNETITDIIACKVMENAMAKGIEISEAPFENGLYLIAMPLLEGLDRDCHKELVKCLMSDKLGDILEVLGGKECDELCEALEMFYDFIVDEKFNIDKINKQAQKAFGYRLLPVEQRGLNGKDMSKHVFETLVNRRKLFEQLRTGEIKPENCTGELKIFLQNAVRVEGAVQKIKIHAMQKEKDAEKI